MIGYEQTKIKAPRRSWIWALRQMSVNDTMTANAVDRGVLSAVISRVHRNNPNVRFTIRENKESSFKTLTITRIK